MSGVFDSETDISGLDNSAANNDSPPSTRAEREDPKQKSDGSLSGKNQSSSEGSRPENTAAYYNGFQQPRTPW